MNATTFVRRRVSGTYTVDPWGLDPDLIGLVSPVACWRWAVDVDGAARVPGTGPALVVFNRRLGLSEPVVIAAGLRQAAGRTVRIVGMPDVAPVGPFLRRLGAAVDTSAEVAALLRAREVVAAPLAIEPRPGRRAGRIATRIVAPAVGLGVPVLPVAVLGHEIGRNWRIAIGAPITVASAADAADAIRAAVQALLDESRAPRRFRS